MLKKVIRCFYFLLLLLGFWCLFLGEAKATDSSLRISQVLYDTPVSGEKEEWVELFNDSNSPMLLNGYKLFSKNDADFEIKSDLLILPKTAFIITKDESAFISLYHKKPDLAGMTLTLANSGDYIGIKDPEGNILSVVVWGNVAYESWPVCTGVKENSSLFSDPQNFCHFSEKTPATPWFYPEQEPPTVNDESPVAEDPIQADNPVISTNTTILEARNLQNGEMVTVSGIVTTLPNELSPQYFYIQDEKSGIQVYSYDKDFPEMEVGDKISVNGELSTTYNERRLKISNSSDIKLLSSNNEYEASKITSQEAPKANEGRVVNISGQVTDKSGNTFFVDDNLGKVKVYLKNQDNFAGLKIQNGSQISITGIMVQYGEIYRILPRKKEDVIIMLVNEKNKEILPEAGDQSLFYSLLISGLIMCLWNILSKIFKKHIVLPKISSKS